MINNESAPPPEYVENPPRSTSRYDSNLQNVNIYPGVSNSKDMGHINSTYQDCPKEVLIQKLQAAENENRELKELQCDTNNKVTNMEKTIGSLEKTFNDYKTNAEMRDAFWNWFSNLDIDRHYLSNTCNNRPAPKCETDIQELSTFTRIGSEERLHFTILKDGYVNDFSVQILEKGSKFIGIGFIASESSFILDKHLGHKPLGFYFGTDDRGSFSVSKEYKSIVSYLPINIYNGSILRVKKCLFKYGSRKLTYSVKESGMNAKACDIEITAAKGGRRCTYPCIITSQILQKFRILEVNRYDEETMKELL